MVRASTWAWSAYAPWPCDWSCCRCPLRTIIVAGTNGKGSTVACLAGISARQWLQGRRIHLATPAALQRAHPGRWRRCHRCRTARGVRGHRGRAWRNHAHVLRIQRAGGVVGVPRARCEFAVLEVGLGGRLDAVNIVDAQAAIVCSIGLDHADWLGTDIEQIGREKAGVFRAGSLAVLADPGMTPSVAAEAQRIGARALQAGRDYRYAGAVRRWSGSPVEIRNAGAAIERPAACPHWPARGNVPMHLRRIAALHGHGFAAAAAGTGRWRCAARTAVPGTFPGGAGSGGMDTGCGAQRAGGAVLAENLRARPCTGRTLLVAGILGDKDVDGVADTGGRSATRWILCGIAAPRGLDAAAARVEVESLQWRAPGERHPARHAHGRGAGARRAIASSYVDRSWPWHRRWRAWTILTLWRGSPGEQLSQRTSDRRAHPDRRRWSSSCRNCFRVGRSSHRTTDAPDAQAADAGPPLRSYTMELGAAPAAQRRPLSRRPSRSAGRNCANAAPCQLQRQLHTSRSAESCASASRANACRQRNRRWPRRQRLHQQQAAGNQATCSDCRRSMAGGSSWAVSRPAPMQTLARGNTGFRGIFGKGFPDHEERQGTVSRSCWSGG